ncbi:metal-dependent hydrolase [Luteolibacter pohnpeiensis]|uniref:Metal-dependent hydrolase n=1 Tax=Luteolibacter pohnpeiensis TaxID=454153 RepID=A0A934VXA2_9BACT|nr:metal-dependent hydrolase [Luteolibacter pohnpeiensis]MBK1883324.1 metal-dependent hydrolase [Luteolibacter pohnpeiensis]
MDSITQAALGAAMGELVLGKKLGNRALSWGALFGILPDLDVLLLPFFNTTHDLWVHRTLTHSLLFIIVAALAISPWLAKLWKRDKVSKGQAAGFIFLVLGVHVLVDCFNVYGTPVLWPFLNERIAFNNLYLTDYLFSAPLVISLVWLAFLRSKKQKPKRRKICLWGLGICMVYTLFSLLAKWAVSSGFEADLHRREVTYKRRMEAPTPYNIILWRSVVDCGDELWVGYRSVFEFQKTPIHWTVYPKGNDAFAEASTTPEAKAINWYSDGWWIARRHSTGIWLGDLRFCEIRTWGARKDTVDSNLKLTWVLNAGKKGDRLQEEELRFPEQKDIFKRMLYRMIGNREKWEGYPRLAGVKGSFPEHLRWIE